MLQFTQMNIGDYDQVAALWRDTEGIGLHDHCDSRAGITHYLQRNDGLSFVARQHGRLIGAVLCGHDGRRGYLHHLAVARTWRGQGVGQSLVRHALAALGAIGICKCHVFVLADHTPAVSFWQYAGWTGRTDLKIMSMDIP